MEACREEIGLKRRVGTRQSEEENQSRVKNTCNFLAFLSLTVRLENAAVQPIFYSAAPFRSGLLFAARLRDRALCIEPDVTRRAGRLGEN